MHDYRAHQGTRCRHSRTAAPTAQALEPRVLYADGTLDVTIGGSGPNAASFVDGDGTAVSVTMKRGTLALRFAGEGLAQAREGDLIRVTGTGVTLVAAAGTGTSRRTSITYAASGGDGRLTIGAISADGPLKQFVGPPVVLTGTLTTGGPVRRLQLLRAQNSTIALGGERGASSIDIAEGAIDSDLSSAAPLRRLDFGSWSGVDGGDAITAPSIGTISVGGGFKGDVSTGAVRSIDVVDAINSSTILINGSLGRLRVGQITDSQIDVSEDIGAIGLGDLYRSKIYAGVRPSPEGSVPDDMSDFARRSSIGRFEQSISTGPDTSVVAAAVIRTLRLGTVYTPESQSRLFVADRINHVMALTSSVAAPPYTRVRLSRLEAADRQIGSVRVRAV